MAEPTVTELALHGALRITPQPIVDERGFFVRTLNADVLRGAGIDPASFVQENQSRSVRGTLRGLHGRRHLSEAKLVRCARGAVFEVVVDLRPWSPTFRAWESFTLDDVAHEQLLVPAGCVHGFQALTDEVDICYRHDAPYDPSLEIAVAHDDPELAIDWPIDDKILSARDRAAPRLAEVADQLDGWYRR
ncbi:MAG: dTDP-4-dehydrorhamnose 3,5-epimerase [Acidimicrobiia bacterium]